MTLEDKRIIEKAKHNAKVDTIKEAEKELARELGEHYEVRSSFTNYTFFVQVKGDENVGIPDSEFVTVGEIITSQASLIAELNKKNLDLHTELFKLKFNKLDNELATIAEDSNPTPDKKEFIPKPVKPFVTPIKNDNNEITW